MTAIQLKETEMRFWYVGIHGEWEDGETFDEAVNIVAPSGEAAVKRAREHFETYDSVCPECECEDGDCHECDGREPVRVKKTELVELRDIGSVDFVVDPERTLA